MVFKVDVFHTPHKTNSHELMISSTELEQGNEIYWIHENLIYGLNEIMTYEI